MPLHGIDEAMVEVDQLDIELDRALQLNTLDNDR